MPEPIILSPAAFLVASFLNGENSLADIQYAFCNATGGQAIRDKDVEHIVEFLDNHGFLNTEKYLHIRLKIERAYYESESRPAHLAGKSYPADPAELREYLNGLYVRDGGPGELPRQVEEGQPLKCMVVPHIDFDRGGHSYAHGYLTLARMGRPDTVIVFGVAHAGPPAPFIMTRKHYETPFGTLEVDSELTERIAAACDWDPFEFEIVHRAEHSIEFQAVMLAHLYGPSVKIVPILCGPFCVDDAEEDDDSRAEAFLEACRAAIASSNRRVSVIAGADLAHVGKRFGDDFDITDEIVARVHDRDQEDLAKAIAVQPKAWYEGVMRDENERRVCGLNCIYSALRLVEDAARPGALHHYGYAPDPAGGIVSFASLTYV
ncbi:MAG: AmmeMemoRadiSam system protein B [Candidatus Hydrogenedentes bacterium]|nr:AmmeMemoRadiSam system protein B [Candidatus Hydrogenedentota bacterium]